MTASKLDKKLKRLGELRDAANAFCDEHKSEGIKRIRERDLALINDYYFDYVQNSLKHHVSNKNEGVINRYKIFSGTELAIIHYQPIRVNDKLRRRELNAEFAFITSFTFLLEWNDLDQHQDKIKPIVSDYPFNFIRKEHLALLTKLDTDISYPIIELSHFWLLMYYYLCKELGIEIDLTNQHFAFNQT